MSKEKLKDILGTPTYCGQEQYLIAKITKYLIEANLDYVIDEYGNIYVTKGVADYYPCVVAHTDSVHKIVEMDIIEHEDEEDFLYAVEKGTKRKTGCGGDNKAGVYVCLELLEKVEVLKAAFFVSEEYGCFGSILSDETFFENVGYVLQFDAPENDWVTHYCNGVKLFDEEGDFYKTIQPILEDYMGDYSLGKHPYTDVSILKAFHDFSCINYSVGYYNMHSKSEYVSIGYAQQARNIALEIISSLGNIKYPFIDKNVKMDKKKLRERALISLNNLRK
jgi:putative aminopeptidase FrvX